MKPRADSLYARLTEDLREEVLSRALGAGQGYEEIKAWLKDGEGIETSAGALSNLVSRFALPWKYKRALAISQENDQPLPANLDGKLRNNLRQQAFAATFDDLTVKEVALMEKTNLGKDKLDLDKKRLNLDRKKLRQAERKIKLLEDKTSKAKTTVNDTALTPEQKHDRLREIFA